MNMVDLVRQASLAGEYITDAANYTGWAIKKGSQAVVGISAELFKEVGGLRSLAGAVSASIKALDLFGLPVSAYDTLVQTCDSFNKAMGGIHVVQRINQFNTDKVNNLLYLTSRIFFISKDILAAVDFLESQAIIAAGTAKAVFAKFSDWSGIPVTPQSISPTFEYVGWGTDLSFHLAAWAKDYNDKGFYQSLSWERGFDIATATTKIIALGLTGSSDWVLRLVRLSAMIGSSMSYFGRATYKYLTGPAAEPKPVASGAAGNPPCNAPQPPAPPADGPGAGAVASSTDSSGPTSASASAAVGASEPQPQPEPAPTGTEHAGPTS